MADQQEVNILALYNHQMSHKQKAINGAVARTNDDLVNILDALPATATNARAIMSAMTKILDGSITSNVDPETGAVVMQSTLSIDSSEKLTHIITKLTEALNNPEFLATISQEEADEMAKILLEVLLYAFLMTKSSLHAECQSTSTHAIVGIP